MRADDPGVPVLTYHSISSASGPTSIAPATFRMQLDALVECGFRTITCDDFLVWQREGVKSAAPRVMITFDDGFADFATTAFPLLAERGFAATVFVPTGKVGQVEDWRGAHSPPRALMSWSTLRELAAAGVTFGGHGVTHADLTRLTPAIRRHEIERSAQDLTERIGAPIRSFAPPYGHVNRAVIADVARSFDVAFGTRLDRAHAASDRFDVPRIEMHYFRDARRWRNFIRGDNAYFRARRALRALRSVGVHLSRSRGGA